MARFLKLFAYGALMIGIAVVVLSLVSGSPSLQIQALIGLMFLFPMVWTHTETVRFVRDHNRDFIAIHRETTSLIDRISSRYPHQLVVGDFQVTFEQGTAFLGQSSARLRFVYPVDKEVLLSPFLSPAAAVKKLQDQIENFLTHSEEDEMLVRWGRGEELQPQMRRLWLLCAVPLGIFALATALLGFSLIPF